MNFGVNGQIAVAKSESPLGPFVVVNTVLNVARGASGKFYGVSLVSFKILEPFMAVWSSIFPFVLSLLQWLVRSTLPTRLLTILERVISTETWLCFRYPLKYLTFFLNLRCI